MNRDLLNEIVKHVFANFAIYPSKHINHLKTKSLKSPDFLLPKQISFDLDGEIIKNRLWACQISTESQELKILLADCSQSKDLQEMALIVKLKNAPTYGLYLHKPDSEIDETMLACSLDDQSWMECGTFLQSTFLAGMEQVREVSLGWNKCSDYVDQYNALITFVKYHAMVYEEKDEGQEERS